MRAGSGSSARIPKTMASPAVRTRTTVRAAGVPPSRGSTSTKLAMPSAVEQEPPQQTRPRLMGRQRRVHLGSSRADLRQAVPGHRGEIVMLVVIAHVEREPVERAVIAERLLVAVFGEVVSLNPARAQRV